MSEVMGYVNCRLFQIDGIHYVNFGEERWGGDTYLTLLVKIRYPNQRMRLAVLAEETLSDKTNDALYKVLKKSKSKF
jgi:hypothetical protein